MRKIFTEIVLVFVLLLSVNSCEYEPTGVYNRHVNQDAEPPQLQVVELNLSTDTIVVYHESVVRFFFNTNRNDVHGVILLIDGEAVGSVAGNAGEIEINSLSLLAPGTHELVMQVYTGSGTGSIAEAVGAEGYLFSNSWKLLVKSWYEHDIKIFVADGLLHITWPDYDAFDFREYIVYRYSYNYNEVEVGRTSTAEFIDDSYVGEGAQYIIKARDAGGKIIPLLYPMISPDLPEMYFTVDSRNHYNVAWGKSKYYNAVGSYYLFKGYENANYQPERSTNDYRDTSYIADDIYFGEKVSLKLRVVPKKPNVLYDGIYYDRFEKMISARAGYPFPVKDYLNDIYPVNGDEFVYVLGCDSIVRYSTSKKLAVEKLGHKTPDYQCCEVMSLSASPSGGYLTARLGCYSKIMFSSSSQMNSYAEINPQTMEGGVQNDVIPVSDVGTGILINNDSNLSFYDFINSRILGTYIRSSFYFLYPGNLKLSANGDYFIINDDSLRLINFSDGKFNPVARLRKPGTNSFVEFDEVNPGQVIFWNGSELSVKRCDDFSTVYEFPLTETLLDIDYRNSEILSYITGHLNVRSFMDGTLLYDIPVRFTPSWGNTCFLINHTIIYTAGMMYFLN